MVEIIIKIALVSHLKKLFGMKFHFNHSLIVYVMMHY